MSFDIAEIDSKTQNEASECIRTPNKDGIAAVRSCLDECAASE